jgi:hypothetical protein
MLEFGQIVEPAANTGTRINSKNVEPAANTSTRMNSNNVEPAASK